MLGKNASPEAISAANVLRERWNAQGLTLSPHTAVILGSGFGSVGDRSERDGAICVPYVDIPGMTNPRVPGHEGRFVAAGRRLDGCLLLQGRVHYYEGYTPEQITFVVRVLRSLASGN